MKFKSLFLSILITSFATIANAQAVNLPVISSSAITEESLYESQAALPQELSDEELDAVTGGNPLITIGIRVAVVTAGAVTNHIVTKNQHHEPITVQGVAQAAAIGAAGGAVGAMHSIVAAGASVAAQVMSAVTQVATIVATGQASSNAGQQHEPPKQNNNPSKPK